MQEFLNFGNETMMNVTPVIGNNWCWRAKKDAFTDELANKILQSSKLYGRCE